MTGNNFARTLLILGSSRRLSKRRWFDSYTQRASGKGGNRVLSARWAWYSCNSVCDKPRGKAQTSISNICWS